MRKSKPVIISLSDEEKKVKIAILNKKKVVLMPWLSFPDSRDIQMSENY